MIISPLMIFFLIIVFISVWFFIKSIDDNRKWLNILLTIVLTPIVYFYLFYPLLNIFSSYHHQKYFNSNLWLEKPALRYEMSNHSIQEKLFIGKSKEAIKIMLGESEWLGWDTIKKQNSTDIWNYNLGFKPGAFNKNQECLELVFKQGKVSNCRQYQLEKDY